MRAPSRLASVVERVRRRGLRGTLQIVSVAVRRRLYWREAFVFYELDLSTDPALRELPAGYELVRVDESSMALAATTGKQPARTRRVLADGHDLWLVRAGDEAAFSCWIYKGAAPEIDAQGGWFALPAGVVFLEDSVTMPDHRGKGVASTAWNEIADELRASGEAKSIVTRVLDSNTPSRRACEKAGFVEIGELSFERTGPRSSQRLSNCRGDVALRLAPALDH